MAKHKNKKKEFWHKKFFVVNVDVFGVDVGFCVNAKESEIKSWLKKMSGEKYKDFNEKQLDDWEDSKTNLGRIIEFSGGFIVLLKADNDQFRKFVSILVHEIVHVVNYLLKNRGISLGEDSHEIYAYLTEYITKEALIKLY